MHHIVIVNIINITSFFRLKITIMTNPIAIMLIIHNINSITLPRAGFRCEELRVLGNFRSLGFMKFLASELCFVFFEFGVLVWDLGCWGFMKF